MEEDPKKDNKEVGLKLYNLHGGVVELPDGTIEKSKMFDVFRIPLDDYSDIRLTLEEMRRVRWHGQKIKHGFQAMAPIICLGPVKCPFNQQCPFIDKQKKLPCGNTDFLRQNAKKFPLARRCPVESDMLAWRIQAYAEEYDVDMESPTELGLIAKLAEIDIYDYRCTQTLATGDNEGDGLNLMKRQTTGATTQGDELSRLEEHPAFVLKEKLHKQRMEILNALVGTRREKYKKEAALKQRDITDPSTAQSDLRKRLEDFDSEAVIDAEFTEHTSEDDDKVGS